MALVGDHEITHVDPRWILSYNTLTPELQRLIATLFVIGNGHIFTNGCPPEATLDSRAQAGVDPAEVASDVGAAARLAAESAAWSAEMKEKPATKAADTHYPATYSAMGFNQLHSMVGVGAQARAIENEDLVNWPDWRGISWRRPGEADWFMPSAVNIVEESYRNELNLQEGVQIRTMRVRDADGRETEIVYRRFVSMADPNVAAIEYTITPLNWSGSIQVRSSLDGSITNYGIERYRKMAGQHTRLNERRFTDAGDMLLEAETTQSHIRMAQAARTRLYVGLTAVEAAPINVDEEPLRLHQLFTVGATQGQTLRVEKRVAIHSYTPPIHVTAATPAAAPNLCAEAVEKLETLGNFEALLVAQRAKWAELWALWDIEIEGPPRVQEIIRAHLFYLIQTVTEHSIGKDVSYPARGWTGESYRGHIFWDILYMEQAILARNPALLKEAILYRYNRLDAARKLASDAGYEGAMFPWQSGRYGDEQTPAWHLLGGVWEPDISRLQRHNTAEVALKTWRYFQHTQDKPFMSAYGAELILSCAKFWSSIAKWNAEKGRFVINSVIGADEYHEDYPGAHGKGINNNSYTNIMAAWVLQKAAALLDPASNILTAERKAELQAQLGIGAEQLKQWGNQAAKMYIPTHTTPEHGVVISQFEDQGNLPDLPAGAKRLLLERYGKKLGGISRMDRVMSLERERLPEERINFIEFLPTKFQGEYRAKLMGHGGFSPNDFKDAKQTDGLPMAISALGIDEASPLLEILGYPLTSADIERHIIYYRRLSYDGSTLSQIASASEWYAIHPKAAMALYYEALRSDVDSLQPGNTSAEAIHLGVMAGTVGVLINKFAGISTRGDLLTVTPNLPEGITTLKLRVVHRGLTYLVDIRENTLHLTLETAGVEANVALCGTASRLVRSGERISLPLIPPHEEAPLPVGVAAAVAQHGLMPHVVVPPPPVPAGGAAQHAALGLMGGGGS